MSSMGPCEGPGDARIFPAYTTGPEINAEAITCGSLMLSAVGFRKHFCRARAPGSASDFSFDTV